MPILSAYVDLIASESVRSQANKCIGAEKGHVWGSRSIERVWPCFPSGGSLNAKLGGRKRKRKRRKKEIGEL